MEKNKKKQKKHKKTQRKQKKTKKQNRVMGHCKKTRWFLGVKNNLKKHL